MAFLPKKYYRPDEVAEILRLSRRTVYRMIRDGRLTAVKLGRYSPLRIPRGALIKIMERYREVTDGGE